MNNLYYDNVDDKKEIYNMLSNYLSEAEREEFLKWCCANVNTNMRQILKPGKNSTFHPKEVYWQLMSLAFLHHLDLNIATQKLTEIVRKK